MVSKEILTLGMELANIVGNRSVESIFDKINVAKKKGDNEETIIKLEEIINELISDKNNLIQIAQAYQEKIITQKITDNEIEYIIENIIPLAEQILKKTGFEEEEKEKIKEGLEIIKSIISKETITILQILGFNFKKSLGEPLTDLVESLIREKVKKVDTEIEKLIIKREIEFLKLCSDEDRYNRFLGLQNN
ncbi:hypothetical protein [Peptoclostridium sp. AF21-18]|uniref:hypothetical protein n=1 Tax=Peptoclostridium sp. AF21-18 TaxID=2292243 RepID=UPI000E4CC24C|nr:hypothetical protein [Peptoclostridium sp. AF21-18]RHQ98389.1 hypothetical protein DWX74_04925 [Peptoclostridium sp. AF21-18]